MNYPRVLAVGDGAVTVELGPPLDPETIGLVRAFDERVNERALPGVLETVPTYAALLVIYDRGVVSFVELSETLRALARGLESSANPGRLVEIPAKYDGDDLDEVARSCGLTSDAVVEIHSAQEYSVLMLGFSPGFAYMGFVDPRLRRPRRKTPRARVPEGAIAIAGAQTGIYPRSLPGGWNLLGRTSLRLFEASSSRPARLMPGDRVRFQPTESLEAAQKDAEFRYAGEGEGVEVIDAGILTTIQDSGRAGLRRLAVPRAGYADPGAARTANECVGNPPDAPLIELCGSGLKLRFEKTAFVAIAGARASAHLGRGDLDRGEMLVPQNAPVRVRAANTLRVSKLQGGARSYVAISGLQAPQLLDSASVDLGSGLLRPIEAGDRFSIGPIDFDRIQREPRPDSPARDRIRVILGPQLGHFDGATIDAFLASPWRVGHDSDRVGARLDGPRLAHAGEAEIVSDGMVPGCVQVPPDGRPIVMLSDCPTTGGYPKIACVVSDDLGSVAQAIPGKTLLRFVAVRIEDL